MTQQQIEEMVAKIRAASRWPGVTYSRRDLETEGRLREIEVVVKIPVK